MLYIENGDDLVKGGKAAGEGARLRQKPLPRPEGQYDPRWDWSGMMQDLALITMSGWALATSDAWPNWLPGDEFRAIRDKSRAGADKRAACRRPNGLMPRYGSASPAIPSFGRKTSMRRGTR
ncbi:hypothetical protein AB5I41_24870 [Sphingomonas sp. MMS24-JH45]